MRIVSNIKDVLARVDKLRSGVPAAVRRVVMDAEHWRSRARMIAHTTLMANAGDKAELVPSFVARVTSESREVGPELSLYISRPALIHMPETDKQLELPIYLAETFRAAFLTNPDLAYEAILQWVSSGEKDRTWVDLKPDGTEKSPSEIADTIYWIIFKSPRTPGRALATAHLLQTEEEAGREHIGGGQRLIDFFAQHPLTKGMAPGAVADLANDWLSLVLMAWRVLIPEEIAVRFKQEISKL